MPTAKLDTSQIGTFYHQIAPCRDSLQAYIKLLHKRLAFFQVNCSRRASDTNDLHLRFKYDTENLLRKAQSWLGDLKSSRERGLAPEEQEELWDAARARDRMLMKQWDERQAERQGKRLHRGNDEPRDEDKDERRAKRQKLVCRKGVYGVKESGRRKPV
ncbi:MAG: hypothetical protein Q9225_000331 [Loekoesia sp. 1 TL-2023]